MKTMSRDKAEEREDKFDLPFKVWPPELVARVENATHDIALTELSLRHYRTVVKDTPEEGIREAQYEFRSRSTIEWDVDPNNRLIVPNSTDLCLKSRRQLRVRSEHEVPSEGDFNNACASLNDHSEGLLYRIFNEAGICNPELDIVDLAFGDVERHYRELSLPITPAGFRATKPHQAFKTVVLSQCLDSVQVIGRLDNGRMRVIGTLAQLEIENKNKVCPHEGTTQRITSVDASDVQIDGAMREASDIWNDALPRSIVARTFASEMSKSGYIRNTTIDWMSGPRLSLVG